MNFVDNTGHIFNLPSFNYNPIGYEYAENRYIFWIDDNTTSFLSVNNYYIRPIYILSNYPISHLEITINSDVFTLIGAKYVQESISKYGYVKLASDIITDYNTAKKYVEDTFDTFKRIKIKGKFYYDKDLALEKFRAAFEQDGHLKINDGPLAEADSYIIYNVDKEDDEYNDIIEVPINANIPEENLEDYDSTTMYMYPFYVIAYSSEEGTVTSNILIHASIKEYYLEEVESSDSESSTEYEQDYTFAEEWCPITVGAEFSEINEMLVINGQNMGISMPREIIRAVYDGSYDNRSFNETLFTQKLKEYLINYMSIRGEIGNYRSAITSLKWFGWGKHIDLVSLFETDNEYCTQFIRDYFDINTDIIESFKHFRNSTLLSLIVKDNQELKDEDGNIIYEDFDLYPNDTYDFLGENQPLMEDLFKRFDKRKFGGRGEETYYWRPYYNFIFQELAFKLSALKYYYEEYFLPVHLSIHNASIHHKVYTNDNKQLTRSTSAYTEKIIELGMDVNDLVTFPGTDMIWLTEQSHIIDDNYNEWKDPDYNTGDYYYIHDTCMNIPIKFNVKELYEDKICDVVMILEKRTLFRPRYDMFINHPINILHDTFHIVELYSKYSVTDYMENYECAYSEDGKKYGIWFKNYEKLKEHYTLTHFVLHDLINIKDDIFIVDVQDVLNEYYNTEFDLSEYIVYNKYNDTGLSLNYVENIVDDPTKCEIDDNTNMLYLYKKLNSEGTHIEKQPSITISIPNKNDINVNPLSNADNTHSAHARINICENIYLRFKYNANYVDIFYINNIKHTDDVYINFFPNTTIIFEKHFRFDPNIDEYANLVIYPKLFTNVKTDVLTNKHNTDDATLISYWIGSYFTLRVLVNNKWHVYNFTVKLPDIQFDMGRLVYKYWDNDLKLQSKFNQLSTLSYNKDANNIDIEFNSFMHEPELTYINHINFFEDFVQYLKLTNARFINGELIHTNKIYAFFDVDYDEQYVDGDKNVHDEHHTQRVYFPVENMGSDIVVPKKYFNKDMIYFLYYRNVSFILSEFDGVDNLYLVDKVDNVNIIGGNDHVLILDDNTVDENGYDTQYNDTENYKVFKYDPDKNVYYLDILGEHYEFYIRTSMKDAMDNFVSRYIEKHFITNSDIYKNQIHVFDLYRLNHHTDYNRLFIHNNIDLKYHGIRFKHDNYINESKLEVSGNINDLIDDISYRDPLNNLFRTEIDDSTYSYMINTYDDLTIYSAYEGDHIMKTEDPQPLGYVYYDVVDENGMYTGEIDHLPQRMVEVDVPVAQSYIIPDLVITPKNNHINIDDYELDGIPYEEISRSWLHALTPKRLDWQYTKVKIDDNVYTIHYDKKQYVHENMDEWENALNNSYLDLFIRRNNITSDTTPLFFTLKLCKITERDRDGMPIEFSDEEVSCYKFKKEIFEYVVDDINGTFDFDKLTFKSSEYAFLFTLYARTNVIRNNIEHIYDEDVQIVNNEPYGIVNNKFVKLHPYYGDEENNLDDNLFTKDILKQQPGYYWFDVDDIMYTDEYMEVLDVSELSEHTEKANPNSPDTDIATLTKWRKYLKIDITKKIEDDINYMRENAYNGKFEYDIINDKLDEGFITIVRIENARGEVSYETKKFSITIIDKPVNVTAFFAIDKNKVKCDDNGDFVINVQPEIRRSYDMYDILEYVPLEYVDEDTSVTISIEDKKLIYGDLNDNSKNLYYNMFTTRVDKLNDNVSISSIECIPELNIDNGNIEYDMYLMHDDKQWYCVYISRETCNKIMTLNNFRPSKDEMEFMIDDRNYKLSLVTSGKRFLVNRYKYVSTNGKNVFDRRDIIAARVVNNTRLPIDITTSNKWELHPLSLGIPEEDIIMKSNAQMCIIDPPYINDEHYPGYYTITYRYNIDRTATHQNKLYGKFRIL